MDLTPCRTYRFPVVICRMRLRINVIAAPVFGSRDLARNSVDHLGRYTLMKRECFNVTLSEVMTEWHLNKFTAIGRQPRALEKCQLAY